MTFYLSKKTRILWQIRIILIFALLCAAVTVFSRFTLWFLLPAAVIAALGLIAAFVYVPFYFKSYRITVDGNSITISKGIFIKTTQIMPFPRLVFAQSYTTPIASAMNLKCVMLKAARGWILIPEIDGSDADFMLDNLKVKPND